jgi:hypothetical protein
MEFKGSKGKWVINRWGNVISENEEVAYMPSLNTQEIKDANALLISKAPEMLEILNHLHGRIDFSCDAWGSNEGIELSNKIGQLIKSATEINE